LRGYPDTTTPAFIVRGSQDVGSWRQIDYFTPREFAATAEGNIYASAGFALEIELDFVQSTLVINREQESTPGPRELSGLKTSRCDGYELSLNGSFRLLDYWGYLGWGAFEVGQDQGS
jgi:hypothetical protein